MSTDDAQPPWTHDDLDDPSAVRRNCEIHSLARRLHESHPEIPLAEITALATDAHAAMAPSRIQSYRMILTEREVRRRLLSRSA